MTNSIVGEWYTVTLGDIVDYGKAEKCRLEDVSPSTWVLELEDIQKESSKLIKRVDAAERQFKSTKNKFKSGDVLYGKLRPYLNKVIIADQEGVATTEVIPMDASPHVDNRYLLYWLKGDKFLSYVNEVSYGVNMPRLGTKDGKAAPFVLPPIAEQKVIAEKLDKLFVKVDSIKTHLDTIPDTLKRFRQSVLTTAVSGKLTEEWRLEHHAPESINFTEETKEERLHKGIKEGKLAKEANVLSVPYEIPESWDWVRLGHLALKITDGAHNTPKVLESGFPYLMAKDLTSGQLNFSENRFVSEGVHRELYNKCKPEVGDLLVVNIGAGTGNNVLIDVGFEFSFKNIAIVKRPNYIAPSYLQYYFESAKQRIFQDQAKGGAQPFLSLTMLNDVPFALPPQSEQAEIVHRVDKLFAYANKVEAEVNAAQERVNKLTQSILAKAFRGELTAKWREQNPELISGENSAEALLAKVKAERKKLKPKKNTRTRKKV
ncbi:restriction endonuclease subunit S [Pseudoalteromonas sp. S4488]|uniref:restriction endonuclease subunit S n=1 Tax=Pseudoalteromonas TaxID=53246 RepID=UPI001107C562|nr:MULTISPECIES: restriction endonuclease subunit S [Pseudoalteromonas]MCG9734351.1 restriction endonuclease subunit S [Pseudoalteromonas shioyasakiensis]TMO39787.1 restriction endonuclease subunit S [Pseudoalteromonas sp. S4488]